MKKHIVTCVKCGRQFDANEGGAYYPESRRYVCKRSGIRLARRRSARQRQTSASALRVCGSQRPLCS